MLRLILNVFHLVRSVFRSHSELAIENLALRQQLAVLKAKRPRPGLTLLDRIFWVSLRRLWPKWTHALVIVKPETVVRWHRAGFKSFWRWKSRRLGRPTTIRELIRRMASENLTYVKWADMWSWEGHAGRCTGLIAVSFT
jgi:hypothetical protein